jgi:hypothetical protein
MLLLKLYLIIAIIHVIAFVSFVKFFQTKPLNKFTWIGIGMLAVGFPIFWIGFVVAKINGRG